MSQTIKMFYGDWAVDAAGRVVSVEGIEKTAQDMGESFKNYYDSENPSHYNGSEFWRLEGNAGTLIFDPEGSIAAMAYECIGRLMDLQADDPLVEDAELIDEIQYVDVKKVGPSSYAFFVKCLTASDELLDLAFDIELLEDLPAGIDSLSSFETGTYL